LDDEKLEPLSINEVINKIRQIVPKRDYDYIFTHGLNGEYGHIRHMEIHSAVKEMIKKGELTCEKAFFFSYKLSNNFVQNIPELKIPVPNDNSDMFTQLSDNLIKNKINLITNFYGFKRDSFETLSCNKRETFELIK